MPDPEGRPEPVLDESSYSLVEPVMEATSISSRDRVSGAKVFAGFTRAVGFLHIASGGEGWLNNDVMSVEPWLLICQPMGTAVWCTTGAV